MKLIFVICAFAAVARCQSTGTMLDVVKAVCENTPGVLTPCQPIKSTLPATVPIAAPQASANAPASSLPGVEAIGCGPTRYGPRWGVSCAVLTSLFPSQGIHGWLAVDSTFAHQKPTEITSAGARLDVRTYSTGKWRFVMFLLTAAGASVNASSTSAAFTGGGGVEINWQHLTISPLWRATTGVAASRAESLGIAYNFGGK